MKKRLFKLIVLASALSLLLIFQSESKAHATMELEAAVGPFGKCGAKVYVIEDGSVADIDCIYHFFRCDCLVIR